MGEESKKKTFSLQEDHLDYLPQNWFGCESARAREGEETIGFYHLGLVHTCH